MYLSVKGLALANAAFWGLAMFIITLVAAGRGLGSNLSHISAIFIGYRVTYLGSLVGLAYGFVSGLIAGCLFAMAYNRFTRTRT